VNCYNPDYCKPGSSLGGLSDVQASLFSGSSLHLLRTIFHDPAHALVRHQLAKSGLRAAWSVYVDGWPAFHLRRSFRPTRQTASRRWQDRKRINSVPNSRPTRFKETHYRLAPPVYPHFQIHARSSHAIIPSTIARSVVAMSMLRRLNRNGHLPVPNLGGFRPNKRTNCPASSPRKAICRSHAKSLSEYWHRHKS
jgi:hypothetical protein